MCDRHSFREKQVFICSECNNTKACIREDGEARPIFCEEHPLKELIRAVWREHIPGDEVKGRELLSYT